MDFNELSEAKPQTAQRLIGSQLVMTKDETITTCTIAETEFYHQEDPASHTYRGPTARNRSMFLEGGHAYVYFIYGMHYCLNIVCGRKGEGSGILIRGGIVNGTRIDGPARLTSALGIDRQLDGHNLALPPLQLHMQPPLPEAAINVTPRVGISKAVDQPWRYILKTA